MCHKGNTAAYQERRRQVEFSIPFDCCPYVTALRPQFMSEEVTYELATARWRRTDTVQIISILGTEIADFPLTFLASCGDNTWRYVLDTVHLLVEPVPERPGSIYVGSEEIDGQEEVPVATEDPPRAGIYRYKQFGTFSEPTFVRGPEYYSRFKSPTLLPGESSASASSQATGRPEQSAFKLELVGRDSVCLLSGKHVRNCVAAHIVPQSRPDLYQTIYNIKRRPNMFDATAGLLLESSLHKAFDTLDWSLYRKGDIYFVHYFIPTEPEHFRLHGKAISPDRFGRFYDPPDPRLIAWHYSQTVMARIRGYSVGMNANRRR